MYWYLIDPADDGGHISWLDGIGDTRFDPIESATTLLAMERSAGKFFYRCLPDSKLWWWFLAPEFLRAISGGNRAGKTTALIIDCVMQMEGWHPLQRENLEVLARDSFSEKVRQHAQDVLKKKKWIASPPVKVRYLSVNFDVYIDKIIGPEFEKWLSRDTISACEYRHEKKRNIRLDNGSFAEFMTYQQDFQAFGGSERHLVCFDEEPLKEIYTESGPPRVLSVGGRISIGLTAAEGTTWTKDAIFENESDSYYSIRLSTYDNPSIPEEYVRETEKIMGAEESKIRIYGEIVNRGGNVYKTFRNEWPWIIDPFEIPENGELVLSIDPHPRTPHAILWVWVDTEGIYHELTDGKPNLYAIDALKLEGPAPYVAVSIRQQEAKIGRVHDRAIIDPSAFETDQRRMEQVSMATLLADAGIHAEKGSKDLAGNIMKFSEMIALAWVAGEEVKTRTTPRFSICKTDGTQNLIWELLNYRWPTNIRTKADHTVKQRPVDKDDHFIECAHRVCAVCDDLEGEVIETIFSQENYGPEELRRMQQHSSGLRINPLPEINNNRDPLML